MSREPDCNQFFNPERFRFVEYVDDETFQNYLASEIKTMSRVRKPKSKTFIDVGAGYGRVLPYLFLVARDSILVEKNPAAAEECRRRANVYGRARGLEGD